MATRRERCSVNFDPTSSQGAADLLAAFEGTVRRVWLTDDGDLVLAYDTGRRIILSACLPETGSQVPSLLGAPRWLVNVSGRIVETDHALWLSTQYPRNASP